MSAEQMDELLSLLGPELTRQSTNFRAAIEPKQRLAVALSRDMSCSEMSVLCGLLFVERWAAATGVDPWGLRDLEGFLSAEVVGTRGGGAVG
ncbi:NADH-quinone oxidoreductase subunit I 1, partial [Dissostichus eleginoides]